MDTDIDNATVRRIYSAVSQASEYLAGGDLADDEYTQATAAAMSSAIFERAARQDGGAATIAAIAGVEGSGDDRESAVAALTTLIVSASKLERDLRHRLARSSSIIAVQ